MQLVKLSDKRMTVTLCETDPVLLKCMLLFLQEEPAIKASPSQIDFENIVKQIGEAGANAMITLSLANKFNFFYFWNGKGSVAYYGDQAFKAPEGMTLDEELFLYAFQPGEKILAYIFRDMITTMAEDSSQLDKDSLYKLLTLGYLKDRRRRDTEVSSTPAKENIGIPADLPLQKPELSSVLLSVESGPIQEKSFTVTLPCTIGRINCDLILDDQRISRKHAKLELVDNILIIEDMRSKNGTRINGETITRKQLNSDDLISIGPISLRISTA